MKDGLLKEVVSDKGEVSVGHIHICNQLYWYYKRGGLSRGWSLKGVPQYMCIHAYIMRMYAYCSVDRLEVLNISHRPLSLAVSAILVHRYMVQRPTLLDRTKPTRLPSSSVLS